MKQVLQSTQQRLFELAVFITTSWLASWFLLWTTLGSGYPQEPIDSTLVWGGFAIYAVIYFLLLQIILTMFRWLLWFLFFSMTVVFIAQTAPALSAALQGQQFVAIPYDMTKQMPATTILQIYGILTVVFFSLLAGFSITGTALEESVSRTMSRGIVFCALAWVASLVLFIISPPLLIAHIRTTLQVIFWLFVASMLIPKRFFELRHGVRSKLTIFNKFATSITTTAGDPEDPLRLGKKTLISQESRKTHMYVVGKTGSGKSKAMQSWFLQDIEAGRGCALIDAHGDLVDDILASLAQKYIQQGVKLEDIKNQPLIKKLVIIDPLNPTHAVSLNPLQPFEPFDHYEMGKLLEDTVKRLWGFELNQAPLLGDLVANAGYLLSFHNYTLMELDELLTEDGFRKYLAEKLDNLKIKHFWLKEYPRIKNDYAPVAQRRFRQFTGNKWIAPIIGRVKSTINLADEMDQESIILCKLSPVLQNSGYFFGAYLVTLFQQISMSRGGQQKGERKPFFLYIDEFQNYLTGTFSTILSEGRKYGLHLVLAHQFINQIDKQNQDIKESVFGNVKTKIAFSVGTDDAVFLAEDFFQTKGDIVVGTKYNFSSVKLGNTTIPIPNTTHTYKTLSQEKQDNVNKFLQLQKREFIVKQDDWDNAQEDRTVNMPDISPSQSKLQEYIRAIQEASFASKHRGKLRSEIITEMDKRRDAVYKLIEEQDDSNRPYPILAHGKNKKA